MVATVTLFFLQPGATYQLVCIPRLIWTSAYRYADMWDSLPWSFHPDSVTSLSPQILGEAFLQSLPNLRESEDDRGHTGLEDSGSRYRWAVSSFGRVCRFWMDVSIAASKIW